MNRIGIFILILGGIVLGCVSENPSKHNSFENVDLNSNLTESKNSTFISNRAVIRDAVIAVTVKNIDEATKAATDIAIAHEGYISSSKVYPKRSSIIRARIPAENLNLVLESIRKLGEVSKEEVSTEDVTDALIDVNETLKSKIALRERLRSLLNKTTVVTEIIEIESQLARLQGEIDSMQGRIKSLEGRVAMSEVRIELRKEYEEPEKEKRILGPLGLLWEGTAWVVKKLWVIYP